MKLKVILVILIAVAALAALARWADIGKEQEVSYNFEVRPILSDKCFSCHGPDANKREAGLRLDIPEAAYAPLKETKNAFAIVRGDAERSELYKRIISDDPAYMMPSAESHLGKLTEGETEIIKRWINQGARYEKHWAFTPPRKAALPEVDDEDWCSNEIDYFVLERMEAAGLEPNKEADKARLAKRVALDLTGLLPGDARLNAFLNSGDTGYEQLLNSLLASKAYGEKMALHWMDVSRYADSYGYQDDDYRTQWPYRDWVIHAFNTNMPYNTFLQWQLAGDLLPDADKEKILATAFLRNHKYTEEGGVIPEEYRVEYVVDKVKTYTKGILGITMECAQCHDHKYDPFSQKEYYQMFAFFNRSNEKGFEGVVGSGPAKTPVLELNRDDFKKALSFINPYNDTASTIKVSVMDEMKAPIRPTYLLKRGVYDQHGEEVSPTLPQSVAAGYLPKNTVSNRLGLAEWTIDKSNPLTARVFVNQVWQELFGRGLVKTSGDFGMQGELPSHPKLLDWLAVDFMEHGWDIQHLLKKIVMSSTYRQSAMVSKKQLEKDPENIYISRAPRMRVKAEFVKDIVMQSSGLLNGTVGGASVKPYQPAGLWEAATSGRGKLRKYTQDRGSELYRRGMYTLIKLTVPPPSMVMFDASNRDQCEVKRANTNTPLQALIMMNDPMVLEASRVLAQRLLQEKKGDIDMAVETAFRKILCRTPAKKEKEVLLSYYNDQYAGFRARKLDAGQTLAVGEYRQVQSADPNKDAALMQTINLMYNMEEAITKT